MTTTTTGGSASAGPSGRSKRKAAQAETNGKVTKIKLTHPILGGMEVEGPKVLPATFSWDYAELQSLVRKQDDGVMGTLHNLIVSIVGDEQAEQIREQIVQKAATTKDAGMELLGRILNDIMESYGSDAGES